MFILKFLENLLIQLCKNLLTKRLSVIAVLLPAKRNSGNLCVSDLDLRFCYLFKHGCLFDLSFYCNNIDLAELTIETLKNYGIR